jgi:hypothetical protein
MEQIVGVDHNAVTEQLLDPATTPARSRPRLNSSPEQRCRQAAAALAIHG